MDLCLPPIAKDAKAVCVYPPLCLHPPSTSLSASAVPYHFNSPVFVSPGRAIRTRHFFFSGRWYHSRLDLAPSASPPVASTTATRTSTDITAVILGSGSSSWPRCSTPVAQVPRGPRDPTRRFRPTCVIDCAVLVRYDRMESSFKCVLRVLWSVLDA